MKSFKKIYKSACLLGVITVSITSCQDWLTIYPQDRVVEENFWEDKNDLEGVRYGAYKQMANTVERLAIWGDLRSDNYNLNTEEHSEQGMRNTYDQIMKGMPDSSMTVFDWNGLYTTINYCNKVLQHGPEVLAKDKQFTNTEWIQMRAEMTALRALNYFYLIRAFKDVPYSTKVINSDSEVERLGLTNQLVVLDSIILDCERVKGQARNRFVNLRDTKGMITNAAIYAMLADMYLWRASLHEGRGITSDEVTSHGQTISHTVKGDYQLAADYADQALASLAYQNEEEKNAMFNNSTVKTINYGLKNCDMIKNDFVGVAQSTLPMMEAQTYIFEEGNSYEGILEMQFYPGDNRKNDMVNDLYGHYNSTHLKVSEDAIGQCYGSWGNDLCKYDSRMWICAQNLIANTSSSSSVNGNATALAGYYNLKHGVNMVLFTGAQTSRQLRSVVTGRSSYNNWIIYRMTEVMLIKAEALACIKGTANNKEAINIVNAIHRRSFCNYNDATKVPAEDITASSKIGNALEMTDVVKMVMNERQIELLGEGKRWFDLVRYAERNCKNDKDAPDERESTEERHIGNGQSGVTLMVETYLKNAYSQYYITLKNRFKNRYGLYCPIYYMEVKASEGAIKQNPVWNKSKYEQ